jgi:hypothetical protein
MASFLSTLAGLIVGPAKPKPVAPKPVLKPKSAERIANEKAILDTRKNILAAMAELKKHRAATEGVINAVDKDVDRAARVVRQILLGQDKP